MKALSLFLILVFTACLLNAQCEFEAEKTLSPYFVVSGARGEVETMPLLSTKAEVNIVGVIADVNVRQTYSNNGKVPIEAVYVFPASTRAAVYALTMRVGNRTIRAKIEERQKARNDYEKAKSEGKLATLMEQERPNVFQMNVANIQPGDFIEVTLQYTELVVPEAGDYTFVFPTVVGPRYVSPNAKTNTMFTNQPFTKEGVVSGYQFDLFAHISAGMPVAQCSSPSHKIRTENFGAYGMNIQLDSTEKTGGNRDFVLKYSLRGDELASSMMLYDDGKEKFFLCMAQPPKSVEKNKVPPREYIFIVDVSGSMNGFPLDVAKVLYSDLMGSIRPTDQFNVLLFAGSSSVLAESSLPATKDNMNRAIEFLSNAHGSGSTEIYPAFKRALALPRAHTSVSRSVIVITDGYVSVEPELFDLVRKNLNKANLFAFGIGSSVNRHLIEGLSHVGGGEPFVVLNAESASVTAKAFRKYIDTPVLSNISVTTKGFETYDIEPLQLPDVFAQRPVVYFGKWKGEAKGSIVFSGFQGKKKQQLEVSADGTLIDERHAAIKYLWARERIRNLDDYNSFRADPKLDTQITQLGLKYHLLTRFTSFIAIDEEITKGGNPVTVKQPLPLPLGVSNSAIGFDLSIRGKQVLMETDTMMLFHFVLGALAFGISVLFVLLFRGKNSRMYKLLFLGSSMVFGSCKDKPSQIMTADSVTFLLGTDKPNKPPYFAYAMQYFESDSLEKSAYIVSSCKSIEQVHTWLKNHRPEQNAWRTIRLVVHGNAWTGMHAPVLTGDTDRGSAANIAEALEQGYFGSLPEETVDRNTIFILDGCNLGKDRELLRLMSKAFGGVQVLSAPYFNIFEPSQQSKMKSPIRFYAEQRHVVFPSGAFPGNEAIATTLRQKYPTDTTNWRTALLRLSPRFQGDSYVHYFAIPVNWEVQLACDAKLPPLQTKEQHLVWVQNQPELLRAIEQIQMEPKDFNWRFEINEQPQRILKAEGYATIYSIVIPLRDCDGNLFKPHNTDTTFFVSAKDNSI